MKILKYANGLLFLVNNERIGEKNGDNMIKKTKDKCMEHEYTKQIGIDNAWRY